MIGGSSGGAFNQGRMFGPAIFSGDWNYLYLYWIAELCGASSAALLVTNLHKYGLSHSSKSDYEPTATDALDKLPNAKTMNLTMNPIKSS